MASKPWIIGGGSRPIGGPPGIFFSRVGIGESSPDAQLHVKEKTSTTNDVVDVGKVEIQANSGVTPAAGLGATILWTLPNASSAQVDAGRVGFEWYAATAGSEESRFTVHLRAASDSAPVADDFAITKNGGTTLVHFANGTVDLRPGGFFNRCIVLQNGIFQAVDSSGNPTIQTDINRNVTLGENSLDAAATNGFPYMPTISAAPSGTPTSKVGYVPYAYDITNDALEIYNGSAWRTIATVP